MIAEEPEHQWPRGLRRLEKDSKAAPRGEVRDRPPRKMEWKCYRCGMPGHIAARCQEKRVSKVTITVTDHHVVEAKIGFQYT